MYRLKHKCDKVWNKIAGLNDAEAAKLQMKGIFVLGKLFEKKKPPEFTVYSTATSSRGSNSIPQNENMSSNLYRFYTTYPKRYGIFKDYYLKLFCNEQLKPYMSVVSPKEDSTFFSTSFPLMCKNLSKFNGKTIYRFDKVGDAWRSTKNGTTPTSDYNIPHFLKDVNKFRGIFSNSAGAAGGKKANEILADLLIGNSKREDK
jgi:hypothetical protein